MVPYPAVEFLFQQAMFHTFWFGIKKIVSDEKQTVAVYWQEDYPGVNKVLSGKTTRWFLGCRVMIGNLIVRSLVSNQKPSLVQRAGNGLSKDMIFLIYSVSRNFPSCTI